MIQAYAFVWKTGNANKLAEYLDSEEYETSTRGQRKTEEARPCGHGVYGLVKKEDRAYLAYAIEFPEIPGMNRVYKK